MCEHDGVEDRHNVSRKVSRTALGKPAGEGESPVRESQRAIDGTRVPRDTRNLVGNRGDHPPRLNTTQ